MTTGWKIPLNAVTSVPTLVLRRIEERLGGQWTGKITLNIKDGRILDIEVSEKQRL